MKKLHYLLLLLSLASFVHAQFTTTGTAGSTNVYTNGYVGIGTTTITAPMHIRISPPVGSSGTVLRIGAKNGGVNAEARIDFSTMDLDVSPQSNARIAVRDPGGYNGSLVFFTDGDNVLNTNLTERMIINQNGNVGIGTSSPGSKLEVVGNISISGIISATGYSIPNKTLLTSDLSGNTNIAGVLTTLGLKIPGGTNGQVLISSGSGVASWQSPSSLSQWTLVGNTTTGSNSITYANGNIAIPYAYYNDQGFLVFGGHPMLGQNGMAMTSVWTPGLTYSENWLTVKTPSTTDGLSIRVFSNSSDNSTSRIFVRADGNVGIGTNAPADKLDVRGNVYVTNDDNPFIQLQTSSTLRGVIGFATIAAGYTSEAQIGDFTIGTANYRTANGNLYLFSGSPGKSIKFGTRPTTVGTTPGWTYTRMEITESGLVKIGGGATIAGALMQVNGTLYSKKNVVTQTGWADDEFSEEAKTPSLEEEETTATTQHHLIGVPKEAEIKDKGLDLGEMQSIQMRKIEQLYKHLFNLSKENKVLKAELKEMKIQLNK